MKRDKRRTDWTGVSDRGRHTFSRDLYEAIRAFIRVKIGQYQAALDRLKASAEKMKTDRLEGQINYFAAIVGKLNQIYHDECKSVPLADWLTAYTHETTDARHDPSARPDQPSLPGME